MCTRSNMYGICVRTNVHKCSTWIHQCSTPVAFVLFHIIPNECVLPYTCTWALWVLHSKYRLHIFVCKCAEYLPLLPLDSLKKKTRTLHACVEILISFPLKRKIHIYFSIYMVTDPKPMQNWEKPKILLFSYRFGLRSSCGNISNHFWVSSELITEEYFSFVLTFLERQRACQRWILQVDFFHYINWVCLEMHFRYFI